MNINLNYKLKTNNFSAGEIIFDNHKNTISSYGRIQGFIFNIFSYITTLSFATKDKETGLWINNKSKIEFIKETKIAESTENAVALPINIIAKRLFDKSESIKKDKDIKLEKTANKATISLKINEISKKLENNEKLTNLVAEIEKINTDINKLALIEEDKTELQGRVNKLTNQMFDKALKMLMEKIEQNQGDFENLINELETIGQNVEKFPLSETDKQELQDIISISYEALLLAIKEKPAALINQLSTMDIDDNREIASNNLIQLQNSFNLRIEHYQTHINKILELNSSLKNDELANFAKDSKKLMQEAFDKKHNQLPLQLDIHNIF